MNFLCDTVYVPYCTFHRSFKEKCPLSGAKTQIKYLNPGTFLLCRYRYILLCFYYVDIGTYYCVFITLLQVHIAVFITLLQVHIAAVQNSNIRGLSLKVNALSCWKYALHQTQPLTYPIVLANAKLI